MRLNSSVDIPGPSGLSTRTPDILLKLIGAKTGFRSSVAVLEVGLSQPAEELRDWAKIWLEGLPTMRIALLVKLTENPPYKSSRFIAHVLERGLESFPSPHEVRYRRTQLQNPSDPRSAIFYME